MENMEPFRVVAALVLVLGLIGLAALVARRAGFGGAALRGGKGRRLALVETLALDPKRRLALVRCDEREHLLLLGPNADVVVARDMTLGDKAGRAFQLLVDPPPPSPAPPGAERKEPSL